MATTKSSRPARTLVTLGVVTLALISALVAGILWSDASLTPKLALDLEGGTQIILQPTSESGEDVTDETIQQAIEIIRQRIDASGVAEAEITSQGGSNIVVAIPGQPDEATLDLVRESAQMLFRPVIIEGAPTPTPEDQIQELPEPAEDAPAPVDASDPAWVTPELYAEFQTYDCTDPANLTGGLSLVGPADEAVVACDASGFAKYVLGPVEVQGQDVDSASSGLRTSPTGAVTNEWIATISFNGEGTRAFRDVTTRLLTLEPPRNQFAMVLDGLVISAPSVNTVIPDGNAEISGNFTRESAGLLARQLNFGALPLTFDVQSEQQISATLGSEQLQRGLLAGLIGLVLVGVYSLFQYRALGLVTVASLALAGVLVYVLIALLSWTQGYRLSLPGVAGIIVAIGITADSFIVYFERVRDELRDGRTLPAAVAQGWVRARRTILASDTVSFLAAIVLYFLAVGGVRGFAFTLGLTTIVDLVVVFLFTHPLMALLARTRFFGSGHPASGLDAGQLGGRSRYVGRGRVTAAGPATPAEPTEPAHVALKDLVVPTGADRVGRASAIDESSAPGAGRRSTIAERRAAERRAAQRAGGRTGSDDRSTDTDPPGVDADAPVDADRKDV